jgi:PUB domain/EsV-1-7 cysteine-rich motif
MASANKPRCQTAGCSRAPSYGFSTLGAAHGQAVLCSAHKKAGMTYIKNPQSISAEAKHVPTGLIHVPLTSPEKVVHKETADDASKHRCHATNCTKSASYAFPGDAEGKFCFSHKSPSMVLVHGSSATGGGTAAAQHHAAAAEHKAEAVPVDVTAERSDDSLVVAEARRAIAQAARNEEAPIIGFKYLFNILQHPEEAKYRAIRKQNSSFMNEVWLNPGEFQCAHYEILSCTVM